MHLKNLYQQWYQVFEWFEWILIDLPHLKSIKLGESVLIGKNDLSCSLIMESNINMNELMNRSS